MSKSKQLVSDETSPKKRKYPEESRIDASARTFSTPEAASTSTIEVLETCPKRKSAPLEVTTKINLEWRQKIDSCKRSLFQVENDEPAPEKKLVIICKSHLGDKKCYMAVDTISLKLYRPLFKNHLSGWPKFANELILRGSYKVTVDPKVPTFSPYPHKNNDLNAKRLDYEGKDKKFSSDELMKIIAALAKDSILDVFGGKDVVHFESGKWYVEEGAECQSLGFVRLHCRPLFHIDRGFNKTRIKISFTEHSNQTVELSYNGTDRPQTLNEEELEKYVQSLQLDKGSNATFLGLGLARPFNKGGNWPKKRCYVCVIGIFTQH